MTKQWSPNVLTAIRLTLGIASIAATFYSYWLGAAGLVFLAALYDHWSNRVARRLNAAAEIPRYVDMLADLTVFGLAPATLYFSMLLNHHGITGYLLALTYPVACSLRLGRFNADSGGRYKDDPLLAAGSFVTGLALVGPMFPESVHIILLLAVSVFVASNLSMTKLRRRK